ncbi:MAG: hypothetical protein B7Z39_02395 [Novosphingobium sp. 12-64-8]|nr:MAG: hypothetical protein B7Z39_02395 [Novosphingobium sp. 12-64-8]
MPEQPRKLVQSAPIAPRPAGPAPKQPAVAAALPAPVASAQDSQSKSRVSAAAPPPAQSSAANAYLPENNVAAAPVSKSALNYLAAVAARTKPTNAMASTAMARADTSGTGPNTSLRDRMPSPQF